MNTTQKIRNLISLAAIKSGNTLAFERIGQIEVHTHSYAEPGYSDPESGLIAVGNWNDVDDSKYPSRLSEILEERYKVEIEWEDEWCACGNCQKLVRTQPDSYGWTRYYSQLDGDTLCGDCIKKDPEEYLESLEDNERSAETIGVDLEANGYVKVIDELENGLHHGQDDDPKKIAKALRARGIHRFIFKIDGAGQFDLRFSVYVHKDEAHLCKGEYSLYVKETKADISPAEACERALKGISAQEQALAGQPGVTVATCHPDGTATVKKVSQQDFIDGKALE